MQYPVNCFDNDYLFTKIFNLRKLCLMRRFLLVFSALLFSVLLFKAANADVNDSTLSWSGSWSDGEGGAIVVRRDGRFLDVEGKDGISVYRSTCLLSDDLKKAQCEGNGVQLQSGHRFLLSSRWTMGSGHFNETWAARFVSGRLSGKLVFKPIAEKSN